MKAGTSVSMDDGFIAQAVRGRKFGSDCHQVGKFVVEVIKKTGEIFTYEIPNSSTTQGKNYLLDAGFRSTGNTANWYMGLIDATGFVELLAADTAASHTGWTEFEDYDNSTRPAWTKSAASAGVMNASAASSFTISAVGSGQALKGAFIASSNTKGGGSGVLWATGQFAADIPIQETDVINITYFTQLTS